MNQPLETQREVSDEELAEGVAVVLDGQRFAAAVRVGVAVGAVGLVVWGFALNAIGWRDNWVLQSWTCLAVVSLAALAVRRQGRGVDSRFATLGAALGLAIVVLGEAVAVRIDAGRWAGPIEFLTSRGGGDWILFIVSASIASSITRTTVDPEHLRGVLRWHDARDLRGVASRYVANRFM